MGLGSTPWGQAPELFLLHPQCTVPTFSYSMYQGFFSMTSWYTRQLEAQKEGKKQVLSVLAKSASMSLARAWSGG